MKMYGLIENLKLVLVSVGQSWFFLVRYDVVLLDVVVRIIGELIRSYDGVAQMRFLSISVGEFAVALIWVANMLGVVIIKPILIIIILLTAMNIIHLLLAVAISTRIALSVVAHWSLLLAVHLLHQLRFVKLTDVVI